jgi:endogenous inhibitor of DNA gyrase (YacG/DUF329 family)
VAGRSKFDTGERAWKRIEAICGICKKSFIGHSYRGKGGKFCSKPCAAIALKHPPEQPIIKKCLFCHIDFTVTKWKTSRKFCTSKCSSRYNERYGGLVERPCTICGKLVHRKLLKKTKSVFCSRACQGISRILTYPKSGNFGAVRRWFSRYGRMSKCEHCYYDRYPGILVLHHKDRDRTNNARSNLEVLCPNCHAIEHLNEHKTGWQHHSKDPRKIELRRISAEKRQAAT